MADLERKIETPAAPTWGQDNYTNVPIDVPCLERLLPAGHCTPGMHGLLGATGVGRTTMGTMVAAAGALRQWDIGDCGGDSRPWVFAVGASRVVDVKAKMIAYAAGVPADIITANLSLATRGESPFDVDLKQLPPELHRPEEGEGYSAVERISRVVPRLDAMVRLIQLDDAVYRRARGPADELRRRIDADPACKDGAAGIVIDDIERLVDAYRKACRVPIKAFSSLLRKFVGRCRSTLADPLDSAVWVTHAIAGSRAHRSFFQLDHKDAAETRHFGDHLDVCFVLGSHDVRGQFPLKVTKAPHGYAKLDIVWLAFDPITTEIREVLHEPKQKRGRILIDARARKHLDALVAEKRQKQCAVAWPSAETLEDKKVVACVNNLVTDNRCVKDDVVCLDDEQEQVGTLVVHLAK